MSSGYQDHTHSRTRNEELCNNAILNQFSVHPSIRKFYIRIQVQLQHTDKTVNANLILYKPTLDLLIIDRNQMTLLIVLAVIFAFDSILVIYVHCRALGKFHVTSDWQRLLAFTSYTGLFAIRNDLWQMHCTFHGKNTVVRFEDIRALELQVKTEKSVLGEFILDLDMEEHWKEERDYII